MTAATAGCAREPVPQAALADEATITARIQARCPEPRAADLAELKARTSRAVAPVDKAAVRGWIDRLEASEERKGAAGQRIASE